MRESQDWNVLVTKSCSKYASRVSQLSIVRRANFGDLERKTQLHILRNRDSKSDDYERRCMGVTQARDHEAERSSRTKASLHSVDTGEVVTTVKSAGMIQNEIFEWSAAVLESF